MISNKRNNRSLQYNACMSNVSYFRLKIVPNILPGHGSVLQSAVSVESPEQSAPPLLGGGFVQLLVLDFDPVPQLKLHLL